MKSNQDTLELKYKLCVKDDPKQMQVRKPFQCLLFISNLCQFCQIYGASELLGLPAGIPDERMMTHPIWSTWAQYKVHINESVVLAFASDIRSHGFQDSQLEIDDEWESCYGEATFNTDKFPDPAAMVANLNSMGFRYIVTLKSRVVSSLCTSTSA